MLSNAAGQATADVTPEQTFRALLRTFGLLRRVMEPYFGRFGISGSQWGVLRVLWRAESEGQPQLRLTDLSERLVIRPASVTGVIDRLQRLGYVKRIASPTDQRSKHVTLTNSGRDLIKRVLEHHPEQIRAVLGGLDDRESADLYRLLERLDGQLEIMARLNEQGSTGLESAPH
jgi:DNA-binding MarR family transcriptional regulator